MATKPITEELKVKIFALYWGQKIDISMKGTPISAEWIEKLEDGELEASIILKPITQINDEDAEEVSKIIFDNITEFDTGEPVKISPKDIQEDEVLAYASYETVDYLRSRGYALSAYGYSVSELVKQYSIQLGKLLAVPK